MVSQCDRYWAYADFIPLEDVISYWCEKSGFTTDLDHCRNAKRAAIVTACKSKAIKYERSDGKTFSDPPEMLAHTKSLNIERLSFDKWVIENFEDESPLPEKPLGTSERNTLYKLIIGMAISGYGYDPKALRSDTSTEIGNDLNKLGIEITPETVLKYLKLATKMVPIKPADRSA
jgi:hypothetical protein